MNSNSLRTSVARTALTAAILLATSMTANAQSVPPLPPPASLKEIWAITADTTFFMTPKALVAAGAECSLWIADSTKGVWRVPCDGSAPIAVGRVGADSNDYQRPWFPFVLRGDTIGVWDRTLLRMSTYLSSGSFIEHRTLHVPEDANGAIVALACDSVVGTLTAWTTRGDASGEAKNTPGVVLALDSAGNVRAPLGEASGAQRSFIGFFGDGRFLTANSERGQVDLYDATGAKERSVVLPLPPFTTQAYEQLILDEKGDAVWVLLAGPPKAPVRTWLFCTLAEFSACRSLVVPHQGAVVSVSIHAGAMYAIERSADGILRVAKYAAQ